LTVSNQPSSYFASLLFGKFPFHPALPCLPILWKLGDAVLLHNLLVIEMPGLLLLDRNQGLS
jgi:hypothetical protein